MQTAKIVGLPVALLLFAAPAFAQTGDVQAQISALLAQIQQLQTLLAQLQGGSSSAACLTLQNNLYPDQTDATTGGEVSKLQVFFGGRVTGYYGPATLQLVQRWQATHGVVSSGDPDTTGYGYVGPKTRAALACGKVQTTTGTNTYLSPATTYVPPINTKIISDATCTFYPNSTGKADNMGFNGKSQTAANCKYVCEVSRNEKYGMNEGGSCIFTGQNGVGQSIMSIPSAGTPINVGPVINRFDASPSSIQYGNSATLSWAVSNSAACGISPISAGAPGLDLTKATIANGVTSVSTGVLTQSATYELRCAPLTGVGGDYTIRQVTVSVTGAPGPATPAVNFQASTNSILVGQVVTLSWNVTNANRCGLQFGATEIGGLPMSGTQVVLPSQTTSYRLWCANDPGTGKDGPSAEKTLTVNVANPTHVFNGNGVSVNAGSNAVAYMAVVNVVPNSSFTVSGTASADGPLTVVLVEIKYAGSTDWNSVSNLTKDGSGYTAVSNSAPVSGGNWSMSFGGLSEGYYHILIYDASFNLKGSGFLVSTWKG